MLYYTVLHDVILSMLSDQLAVPTAPIVARKTHLGPGWAALGFALGAHVVLLCLLLQRQPALPVALPVRPIEVTLDVTSPDATVPLAIPAAAPTPALSASDPEPKPALPQPAESVPDAAPPPPAAAVPDVAVRRADSPATPQQPPAPPLTPPTPARHVLVKSVARGAATPTVRARKAGPEPDAAPSPASGAPPAPSAPPAQAAPALQQAPSPEAIGGWRSALSAWLQGHRSYPDAARRDGVEGRVVVRFTIDSAGLVIAVVVVGSSGSAVLDEAAQALLRGAHLPAPPTLDHLSITLPINYALAR